MPSVPPTNQIQSTNPTHQKYSNLAKFLLTPFVETPEEIIVDCEQLTSQDKLWIRLALGKQDQGKVSNEMIKSIPAVRHVLEIAGKLNDMTICLDIFGDHSNGKSEGQKPSSLGSSKGSPSRRRRRSRSGNLETPKPTIKPKLQGN